MRHAYSVRILHSIFSIANWIFVKTASFRSAGHINVNKYMYVGYMYVTVIKYYSVLVLMYACVVESSAKLKVIQ